MILCCGEALIDMLPREMPDGEMGFRPVSGGAIFNTSIALGRLGVDVGLLTAISTDMFGEQLMSDLATSKVDTTHVMRSNATSTLAFVKLENGQAKYAFFDSESAESQLHSSEAKALPADATALYFGGISLAREPSGDFYERLAQLNARKLPVMIDPNIRTDFIENPAAYRKRLKHVLEVADIIKVSDEDLVWLEPDHSSERARIEAFTNRYRKIIITTRGAEGASAYLPDGTIVETLSQKVDVVDTVGAGDTFNAGVLSVLERQGLLKKAALQNVAKEAITSALSFGARVAAITVARAGANPPWKNDMW